MHESTAELQRRNAFLLDGADHVVHWPSGLAEDSDSRPRLLVAGHGATVTDADGREYVDGTAILGASQIGHGREDMAEAIADQVRTLEFASLSNGYSHAPALALGMRLAELTPGRLSVSFFSTGGAEAIETGIKIARHYHRQHGNSQRTKVIGRLGSYHGLTFGALSATGLAAWREPFLPLLENFLHVQTPYAYQAEEQGWTAAEVGQRAAESLEAAIRAEGPETVAAFIAEPVPIPWAVRVPPEDYWRAIREICDRYGVLLIIDEILNGFGRTGRLFACEHWGIEPDIMALGKGITSGYIPLSATVVTDEIAATVRGELGEQFLHGSTYAGHPVACAAALANLAIFENEDVVARGRAAGERLLDGLRTLTDLPYVGNVSGIGALASIELVSDKATKRRAPDELGITIVQQMAATGVLIRSMPYSIYFYPPLIIDDAQVDRLVSATADALEAAA
jgi:adenosylmethionine-8-amino-7-oxononanoate aminotransferase